MIANGCCSWGALKLSTGETRPSVGDSMEDACSPSSSSPLHCLSTASGKCILRASVCTCFVLDCWLHRAEILPRYLFLSGMLKNTAVFPPFTCDFSWMMASCNIWVMITQARVTCGISEAALRAACRVIPHLCSRRLHSLSELHQALSFPSCLAALRLLCCFQRKLLSPNTSGCLKENLPTNQ